MGFAERMVEYMELMGLDKMKRADAANAIGITQSSLWDYRNGRSAPTFDGLEKIAGEMYVSLDWLLGRTVSPLWSAELSDLRHRLYLVARDMSTSIEVPVVRRIAAIIRAMQSFDQRFKREWFMAGVLQVTQGRLESILGEACDVDEELLGNFCRFTGLSEMWVQIGEEHFLETPDLGEYVSANRRLRDEGITGAQLEAAIPMIKRVLTQMNSTKA